MNNLTELLLAIAVLIAQTFLSRREQAFWGAVLPVLYIGFLVYGEASGLFKSGGDTGLLFIGVLGTVILLSIWTAGRKHVAARRKKELEKIEIQNI